MSVIRRNRVIREFKTHVLVVNGVEITIRWTRSCDKSEGFDIRTVQAYRKAKPGEKGSQFGNWVWLHSLRIDLMDPDAVWEAHEHRTW